MKTKHLFILLSLAVASIASAYSACDPGIDLSAYSTWTDPSTGILWAYTTQSDGTISLGYSDYPAVSKSTVGDLSIPANINGKTVTSIGWCAFEDCSGLTSVTIPTSVTSIGGGAFSGCSGLSTVTIPPSVMSIGASAFYGTKLLNNYPDGPVIVGDCLVEYKGICWGEVVIPNGVRLIADSSFEFCSGLISVTIPSSVSSIGRDVFRSCSGLTSVMIPSSVTSIGYGAFYGCSGLVSVTLPEGVTKIGDSVFSGCSGLTSVTIPEGVTSIGSGAFCDCSGLVSVTIPSSVTSIGNNAFYGTPFYSNLPKGMVILGCVLYEYRGECPSAVTISSSVTSIGNGAFYGCSGLTSVTIPSSVTSIGYEAFYGCSGLTSVTIPPSVTSIGGRAFSGCSGLTSVTIPEGVTSIESGAFGGCIKLETVVFPRSLRTICCDDGWDYGAFRNCVRLREITICSDIENIELLAFENCNSIERVHVIGGNVDKVRQLFKDSGVDVRNIVFDSVKEPEPVVMYTIAFDSQGGLPTPEAIIREKGVRYGTLPVVEKEDAVFKGWYTEREGGSRVFDFTLATADMTLYAHWKCIGSTADEEVIAGEKVTIETGLVGYKASGLPKGLSYNAKTGKITGTTKSVTAGAVEVVFTKAGEEDVKMTFEVRAEDVSVGCAALATGSFQSGVMGAAGGIPIETFCETGVKSVSVTKLPSGMKYDSKNRLITGAPNKAGNYEVVLTMTTTSGAKETVKIPVSVAAMPVMAVGTFTGFVSVGEDTCGTFTLTTTDLGKLTAKVVTAAGTVSFSGTCWDGVEDGVYRATLTTKKGDALTLTLDSTAAWDANQLSGAFTTALIPAKGKSAEIPSRTYSVSAQRNAFGKTWYFTATGDETTGWKLAYTEDTKGAALTVTLKADGSTSIAGKLPNGTDANGKQVTFSVSASGYANVGGLKDGAILADFAPVLTVNKVKTVLAITTNLWFDRKNEVGRSVGAARFVK